MASQFTLGKNERLKSRKQIEQLFREGKSFSATPFRVYYHLTDSKSPGGKDKKNNFHNTGFQFAVGVSGKNFKRSVDRNRIKRIIREAFRRQKNELNTLLKSEGRNLVMFFIFTGKQLPDYKMVFEKMGVALQKLINIVDKKPQ